MRYRPQALAFKQLKRVSVVVGDPFKYVQMLPTPGTGVTERG